MELELASIEHARGFEVGLHFSFSPFLSISWLRFVCICECVCVCTYLSVWVFRSVERGGQCFFGCFYRELKFNRSHNPIRLVFVDFFYCLPFFYYDIFLSRTLRFLVTLLDFDVAQGANVMRICFIT